MSVFFWSNVQSLESFIYGSLFRFPKLRLLDFRKIRQKDRKAAIELFKSKKGKEILKEIAKKANAAAANPMAADSNYSKGKYNSVFFLMKKQKKNNCEPFTGNSASSADVQRIRDAIKNATSLHEVERLTRILQSGHIPEDLSASENGNGKRQSYSQILVNEAKFLLIK